MRKFKYVKNIGYINTNNIKYISDPFRVCEGTWKFNIHFIDESVQTPVHSTEDECEAEIRKLIEE